MSRLLYLTLVLLLVPTVAFGQDDTINGTVTDAETGTSLPGVNVVVKGTTIGTATDASGQYSLTVPSLQDTLVFSFVGYEAEEMPITGRSVIDVQLVPEVSALEQVVVVGYGTQKKVTLTGSVTEVSGEELDNRVMSSVVQGLQGLIPGMNISVTDAGGEPGATSDFNIRGVGSLSGGSPYVLVDGVPQDLSTVNPQVIESISVLKGAAASAIYGAHAPFGVILVTTKQGSATGDVDITYSANTGWNTPTVLPDMVNSLEWARTFNQAAVNAGQTPFISDETLQRIKEFMEDPENTPPTVPSPLAPNQWSDWNITAQLANANNDWYDIYYKPWAMNQTHNLSVSGGSEAITYYLSGGLFDQGGQLRYGDEGFRRYNLTANVSTEITDWLGLDVLTKFSRRQVNMPNIYGPDVSTIYDDIARKAPTLAVYGPNGHLIEPTLAVLAQGGREIDAQNQFLGSFQFLVQPFTGWDINVDLNYRLNVNNGTEVKKKVFGYRVDGTRYPYADTYPTSYAIDEDRIFYRSANVYTSYQLSPGEHFVEGLVGVQGETLNYSNILARKTELISAEVPSISTATGTDDVNDAKGHWATQGIFMRFRYNYDEIYLLEFNARYDGSSRFPEGDRWGFFPSVSAGYNIANEPFWEGLRDEVNLLKIRASYGSLGNHDVPNYLYIASLGVHTNLDWIIAGSRPIYVTGPGLTSSSLTWETVSTLDLGLDAEMLKGRLSLTFDWFQRTTTNMFGPAKTYPGVLGTSAPRANNADLVTKGVEVILGWRDQIGQVNYHVEAYVADHQTTVTRYNNDTGYIYDYYAGMKLGEIWGYTSEGLYPTEEAAESDPVDQSLFWSNWSAGDVNYKDLNGDGKIDDGNSTLDDHGDLSIIGNSTPRYSYSVDLGMQWKGIDFSMLWQGVARRDFWLSGSVFWGISGNLPYRQSTVFVSHLDYWRPDNKDAYYPKPYGSSEGIKNHHVQTRYLQNGAYLRLKNLQLGYTLPQTWMTTLDIEHLRIYFSAENLLTFSPILKAFDPEAIGGLTDPGELYPLATTISIGVNVTI